VSEGSGENVFVVYEGTVLTPPLVNSVLPGITRSAVTTLCNDLGIPCEEKMLPRELLYIAEEVMLVGTATEISPVRSIDRQPIGNGSRGPITKKLQDEFFALALGEKPDRHGWLTHVNVPVNAAVR
ncbi:MAG TPA: aminotransferase class IV, partial [Candidatus Acidoferrales bacterium]|nr:aminotransferase class IV [Candidatus Acidoferrales bacterium]